MAVNFNPDTDVSYGLYKAAITGLSGYLKQQFDEALIQAACDYITESTNLNAAGWIAILALARSTVAPNGVGKRTF